MGTARGVVLIVDDDVMLRRALESALVPAGYRVRTAADHEGANAVLAAEPVDAVLLDVRMASISGLAMYLVLTHRWPQLAGRIAIMTGDAEAEDVQRWLMVNPCTVFPKPFRFDQITDWLDLMVHAPRPKLASR